MPNMNPSMPTLATKKLKAATILKSLYKLPNKMNNESHFYCGWWICSIKMFFTWCILQAVVYPDQKHAFNIESL